MLNYRKRLFPVSDQPERSDRQLSDADVLLLFWEAFGIRVSEIKQLLDRALCVLHI